MKYLWTAVLLSGLLVSAPGGILLAREGSGPGREGAGGRHWNNQGMQKKLELTDAQVAQLDKIRAAERDALKPLREKQRDLMKTLQGQVKNKAADTDIKTTQDALQANRKAMMEQAQQFRGQRDAVLTPTQRAKMTLKRERRMDEMHEKMRDKHEEMGK